jgi:hypothetical protein
MGYIIGQIDKIKCLLEFDLPTSASEQPLRADFQVEFKIPSVTTAKARIVEVQKFTADYVNEQKRIAADPSIARTLMAGSLDEAYLREDVVDIVGIKDKDGNDRNFTTSMLEEILNDAVSRPHILQLWSANIFQGGALKRKN